MMPGMSGIDASQIDEKAFDRIEAMIYSMTKRNAKASIINPKAQAPHRRRQRHPRGTTSTSCSSSLR